MSAGPAAPLLNRLEAVRASVRDAGFDGLLVNHLPNVRYLTGFTGSSALLLVLPGSSRLITDFRYDQQARDEVQPQIRVRVSRNGLLASLAAVLEEGKVCGRIGFEARALTVRDRYDLGELCDRVVWEAAPSWIERRRATKEAPEVAAIERAAQLAESALQETLETLDDGITELELTAELEYRLRQAGSEGSPFEPIVASGPRSALPHARPSSRSVSAGDLVLFDFGARVDGYCSDITRTVVLGTAATWQREIYDAVAAAQEAALGAVRAQVAAREVDAAARGSLRAAGLADFFGHGTGHGIGLEVHEGPRIYRRSEDVLTTGNVVTIEPGVYLPGRGGVRIEDDVVVEEGGACTLTRFPRALLEL